MGGNGDSRHYMGVQGWRRHLRKGKGPHQAETAGCPRVSERRRCSGVVSLPEPALSGSIRSASPFWSRLLSHALPCLTRLKSSSTRADPLP